MNNTGKKLLLVIFLILLIAQPVLADSVLTFRDRSPVAGHQGFLIYQVNSTDTQLLGEFNTSSDRVVLDPNSSYILQFTTSNNDYFANPMQIPVDFFDYIKGTYNGWILIGFLLLLAAIAIAIAFG